MREAMARATAQAARFSGGRPVRAENLHVTLAFLGAVREGRLAQLADIGRRAAALGLGGEPALVLAFDHLEYWRAAQLLCALPPAPPAPIAALARRLQELLADRGFASDLKPFRPHVTVARKVSRPAGDVSLAPLVWRFTELALLESRTLPEGALYSVVESFPLCGGAAKPSEASKVANNSETR